MDQVKWELFESREDNKAVKYLWKYWTLPQLFDFLLNNQIWFSRLDKFDDPYEAITNRVNMLVDQFRGANNPSLITREEDAFKIARQQTLERQKKIFACAFYSSEIESVAMWRLYSKEAGIAVKFDIDKLQSEIMNGSVIPNMEDMKYERYYGLVDYVHMQSPDIINPKKTSVKNTGFKKDTAYEHEKEFRFLYSFFSESSTEHLMGFYHRVSLKVSDFEIIISPMLPRWQRAILKSTLLCLNETYVVRDSKLILD